jgi:hypothetical protein
MLRRIFDHLDNTGKLVIVNAVMILALIFANALWQIMCVPTTWAKAVLCVCFANTMLFPLFYHNKALRNVSAFLSGISFCVFLYCVLFMEQLNFYALLLLIFAVGIFGFIPHILAFELLWVNLIKPKYSQIRLYFLSAVILCAAVAVTAGIMYCRAINDIQKFEASGYTTLNRTFMTEKILGMHFIYHTRYCEYDGWRPPKHEPLLILGMWLNGRYDPMHVDLEQRLKLYRKFFPGREYKSDCSCAIRYSDDYFNDSLWKTVK